MYKHYYKLILSIALVIVLVLSINPVSYATDPAAFAGAFNATMQAGGVGLSSTMGATGYEQSMKQQTNTPDDWNDPLGNYQVYYQRGAKTESGVTYDYVWLSNEIAQYCADQGIAFLNDKNIGDNESGTFIDGSNQGNTPSGIPVYRVTSSSRWQTGQITIYPAGIADFGFHIYSETFESGSPPETNYRIVEVNDSTSTTSYITYWEYSYGFPTVNIRVNTSNLWEIRTIGRKPSQATYTISNQATLQNYPVTTINGDIDYSTGNIDLAITAGLGVGAYIASGNRPSGVTDGYYPASSATAGAILGAMTTASANNELIDAVFVGGVVPPTPTPTPTPYPTDALGDIPYDEFAGTLFPKLDDIENTVDTVGQSIEDKLDDVADSVNDTIGLGTSTIAGWLSDIYDAIIDGVADIVEAIEGIAEAVLEAIESFFETLFGDIQSAFGGWIADISDAFGIWHYVVEWLSCISTYFTFLRTIASGMPSCFWSPVLALVAGTIVLGVYKRFLQ